MVKVIVGAAPYSYAVYNWLTNALGIVLLVAMGIDSLLLPGERAFSRAKPPFEARSSEERARIRRLATDRAPIDDPVDVAMVRPFVLESLERARSWRRRILLSLYVVLALSFLYLLVLNAVDEQCSAFPGMSPA
jgi:hypothetical protein